MSKKKYLSFLQEKAFPWIMENNVIIHLISVVIIGWVLWYLFLGVEVVFDDFSLYLEELGGGRTIRSGQNVDPMTVGIELSSVYLDKGSMYLTMQIPRITLYPQDNSTNVKICLKGLYLYKSDTRSGTISTRLDNIEPVYVFEEFCNNVFDQSQLEGLYNVEGVQQKQIITRFEIPLFARSTGAAGISGFPLDEWQSNSILIWVDAIGEDGENQNIEPILNVNTSLINWDEQLIFNNQEVQITDDNKSAIEIVVILRRLRTVQIFSAILFFLIGIFIFLMLFALDDKSALEIGLAIMLGLLGIPSVIVPKEIEGTTIIHFAVMLLYVLFALVSFMRFIVIRYIQEGLPIKTLKK